MVTKERNKSRELVKDSLEKLNSSGRNFSNPEDFNFHLVYRLNKGLKEIANTMHSVPIQEIKDTSRPDFIYLHYDFLDHNIRELCVLREGNSCCEDKSRSILEMYLKYSLTGKIPEFNPDKENYWTPNFGTYKEWIDLCDGLYSLYYGKTQQYFKAYSTLIQTKIRRYKHILHTWYIEFKDGQVVKFDTTWDDKQENPLNNEYFNNGNYYLVCKEYVENRNYEIYEDEESISNRYCKVPKSDINKIYKISEEKNR